MYLSGAAPTAGRVPLPRSRRAAAASCPDDLGERVLLAVDCANERRIGEEHTGVDGAKLVVEHRPPPRQLALRRRQPDRRRRLVDGGDRARHAARARRRADTARSPRRSTSALVTDTGRFQYTNTTPKALRLAAELVEAGADVHGDLPARLRDGAVREAQAARARARARAALRGRPPRRLVPPKDDFADVGAEEPYSEGIID